MQQRKIIKDNQDYLNYLVEECEYLDLPQELADRVWDAITLIDNKLQSETVHLALVGGFSAGKSTLINAILGEKLLTSRVNPTTICPTYIVYGDIPKLTVNLHFPMEREEIITEIIHEVTLHGDFLSTPLPLVEVGDYMYQAKHVFHHTGEFRYEIHVNGRSIHTDTIHIWVPGTSVEFCYSGLGNRAATDHDCLFLPEDKLPTVKVTGRNVEQEVMLKDIFLTGEYGRAVFLEPGEYGLKLGCDWDYLNSRYSVVYKKRREPRSMLHMLLNRLRRIPPYIIETRHFVPPQLIHRITVQQPGLYWIGLKLAQQKIEVHHLKESEGVRRSFVMNSEEDKRIGGALIAQYTAAARGEEPHDYTGIVDGVRLEYPSQNLRQGLTIIDTPGISAEEEHTQITLDVINNEADACMFLCPADQAGTLSDLEFVRERLEKISGEILFVVTKTDLAGDDEELQELIEVILEKIRQHTGIYEPKVLAVSPLRALRAPQSREGKTFYEAIKAVIDLVTRNRDIIMVRHLLKVEHSVMELLSERAHAALQTYYQRLQELQSHKIQDIRAFVEEQKPEVFQNLEEIYDEDAYLNLYRESIRPVVTEYKNRIKASLELANSTQELKERCEGPIAELLREYASTRDAALRTASAKFSLKLNELLKAVFRQFEERFEEQYSLDRLTLGNVSVGHRPILRVEVSTNTALEEVSEAMGTEAAGLGLGMAGGAILGSLIFPGIGTIIGGLVGSFFGSLFGPPIENVRGKFYRSISRAIDDQLSDQLYPHLEKMIALKWLELNDIIVYSIEKYVLNYDEIIRSLIEEHEQKKRDMEQYVKQANEVITELNKRQTELVRLGESLVTEYGDGFREVAVSY